jgi:hypothetical protein
MKFQLVEINFFPQEMKFHNSMCFDLSWNWTFGLSLMQDSYPNENMLGHLKKSQIYKNNCHNHKISVMVATKTNVFKFNLEE